MKHFSIACLRLQVVVPITVLAVYHAFAYCAKNIPNNILWRRFGVRAHAFLASHQVHQRSCMTRQHSCTPVM